MAINDLGMVRPGSTILVPFSTYDSNDPSDSVIVSAFVLADIGIYKGTSMIERASTTGVVLLDTDGINIDGAVGMHGLSIDLSSNATADFYTSGSRFYVTAGPMTVDAATTVSAVVATFEIGYPGAIVNTTIATLASQTGFTLTAASADDDAFNGWKAIVHDIASAIQICVGYVSDYTGSSKTITLAADPGIFTMAAGDHISLFPPDNVQAVAGTTQTAGDLAALISAVDGVVDDILVDTVDMQPRVVAIEIDTGTTLDGRIPAALVSGRMDSSLDGTGMESGAVDAIWAKAMTELGAVPGVTGTVLAGLEWLFLLARNKGFQTSPIPTGTKTLRNDADDADIATSTITDDGTTFTRNKYS